MSVKRELRSSVRERLRALTPEQSEAESVRTREALAAHDWVRSAGGVMLFLADTREPDLDALAEDLLGAGVRVALPRMAWDAREITAVEVASIPLSTEVRRHGIREPLAGASLDPCELACVVVPGVAFDHRGGRLGRGAGFYDRFLARLSPTTRTIGVGFACQGVERVPIEEHDRMLDEVLLDGRSIIR